MTLLKQDNTEKNTLYITLNEDRTVQSTLLIEAFSVFTYRFCAGDWTCHILQDRTLHTLVLLLLLGYSGLPAGHNGCSDAHLEHSTSPWRLSNTPCHNHQSLTGITLPSTPRQWLRGVALLRLQWSVRKPMRSNGLRWQDCQWSVHNQLGTSSETLKMAFLRLCTAELTVLRFKINKNKTTFSELLPV